MKNYNKFILWGIILFLLIPVFGFSHKKEEDKDLLMGILDKTGANFLEGDINIGGDILDRFIGVEEITDIGEELISQLDIERSSMAYDITEKDGFIQLMVQGFDDDDNIATFTLSSYEDIDESFGETSLFINLINSLQFLENNDIIYKIESFFDKYDKPVNVATCIVGTFDGELNLKEKEKDIFEVTKSIKGKIVEKHIEDNLLSFSIFTPYIEEYIYTGDKKMNLNIALSYNEYENKTYIWIGTPIITIGY